MGHGGGKQTMWFTSDGNGLDALARQILVFQQLALDATKEASSASGPCSKTCEGEREFGD